MPDKAGNQKGEQTETPLHAYKDGREEEIEPGSLGTDPDESRLPEADGEEGSYQRGGHEEEPRSGDPDETDSGSGAAGDEGLGSKTGGLDGPGR